MSVMDDVLAAKYDFEEFATNDKFIDQGYYDSEDGVVVKDYHMEWVNALENNQKVAITAFTGSGKCISKEERIPLANGEMKKAENVQIGDDVLSFNTDSQSIEPAKVSNFVENGVKDVYCVTTRNGRSLKVTGNHPFYTNEGWKVIENGLSEGDFVAQPVNLPTVDDEDSKLSVNEGRLLGALTAEAGLTGNNITFSNGCKEFTEEFKECIKEWRVELSKKGKYDYRVVNNGEEWRKNQLLAFLDDLGLMGCSSKTKFVPSQLFNSSAEVKSAFVSWLWAGDGYITSRNGWEVSICLTNKKLVEQLQDILLSLGIKSRVAEKKTVEDYDNAWRLSVETAGSVVRFAEVTDIPVERKREELDKLISKLEDKERNTNTEVIPVPRSVLTNVIESYEPSQAQLAREMGCSDGLLTMYKDGERLPSKDNLRSLYEKTGDERLARFLDSDVRWDKVVDIEYIGEEETVDLTVPKNHSFVANGFVTHNTSIPGVLYPLWRIFRDPSTNILIISATLSQATRILNEIKHHIEHADYLEELKPEDRQASWSKSKVEFTTGGEIKCKPIGNGAKAVKGSHVDLAICTPGYTRVETPEGSKKIEDVSKGDLVKTHKGRFKPVEEKMVRETTGTGYEIDAGGLHVRLTPEHPVRVDDEWVSAENVEEGDILQYPVDEGVSKEFELRENGEKDLDIKLDKKFARLLGWYMAEGSLTKRGVRITNADSTDLGQIQSLMDDKLGGYSIDDHLSWSSNVLFSSVDLRDNFEEWFNSCATEKKVPDFIFEASEVVKGCFLETWIRGDGTDVHNDDGKLKETTLYTSSKQAVEDAKTLVESIGGEVTVSKHSNEDSTFGGGDRYHVFMHSRTARKVKALATNKVEDGKLRLPVSNVKKTRVSNWSRDNKVYNLKVKDDNSYVANGVATHNCDEAAEFDDQEKFHRNVRTRVESQSGDICLISTPVHENDLMANVSDGQMEPKCKLCRRKLDDGKCPEHGELEDREIDGGENISEMGFWNKSYGVYEENVSPDDEDGFPLTTSDETKYVKPLFPENFDRQKIMKLREENMTMFQKEYLCEPLAVEGDLFDPNDIIELYDKDEEFEQRRRDGCDYYMGADFAISHQGDYSVFTVVEVPPDDKPVVRWMERIRGMGIDAQEDRIKDLHSVFNFTDIVLDETNFGSTAKKNLKQAGLPITGQDFKMKARNNLIVGLKSKIESEEFRIARGGERSKRLTDKLYNELLGFGTTETQSGSVSYKSTAKHDDTVMSLAMVMSSVEEKKDVVATLAF